jgi:hypothetical protein
MVDLPNRVGENQHTPQRRIQNMQKSAFDISLNRLRVRILNEISAYFQATNLSVSIEETLKHCGEDLNKVIFDAHFYGAGVTLSDDTGCASG